MRWAVIGGIVLAAVIAGGVVGRGISDTGRIPLSGCRVTSVDESTYVAGNRAILDALTVYPGSTRRSTMSHGWFASDACLSFENSGPIDRYQTRDSFTLPSEGRPIVSAPWKVPDESGSLRVPAQVPAVLIYYDRELRRLGWRRSHWSGWEVCYRKDEALLCVGAQLNLDDPYERDPYYTLDAVHDVD